MEGRSAGTSETRALLEASGLLSELERGESVTIRASGHCMEPTFFDGDELTVLVDRVSPGDIVVFFDRHSRLVVHRLLGFRSIHSASGHRARAWVTAADAAGQLDAPVLRDAQIGRVAAIEREAIVVSYAQRCRSLLRFLRFALSSLRRRVSPHRR